MIVSRCCSFSFWQISRPCTAPYHAILCCTSPYSFVPYETFLEFCDTLAVYIIVLFFSPFLFWWRSMLACQFVYYSDYRCELKTRRSWVKLWFWWILANASFLYSLSPFYRSITGNAGYIGIHLSWLELLTLRVSYPYVTFLFFRY